MRRLAPLAVAALLAVPAAAPADDRRPRPVTASPHLWATINICDTEGHPDGVGIRGSMPGSRRRRERMHMRFQLQYLRRSDGRWHNTGPGGDSGWLSIGHADVRRREAGHTFTITPPANGSYLLRGAVTFEWRRNGEVVRRARRRTTAGHERARGGDPRGFSAATCSVS